MPIELNEIINIKDKITIFLEEYNGFAYSSKEIATNLNIAHSTARKHLKKLFDERIVKRGKQKDYNKTFFYYIG